MDVDILPAWIDFGGDICGDLRAAEQREWLVTNGLGSFASGTVAGLLTRRYHGLLFAALKAPLDRTLLVSKFDESVDYDGQGYPIFANRWTDGTVDPHGYRHLERFRLEGTTPVWTFACADALLQKRVWMQQGVNTTYIRYDLVRGGQPLKLAVKVLVNHRDYHSNTHAGDWRMRIDRVEKGLRVTAVDGATPFYVLSASEAFEPAHEWYRNFDLAMERARGLDDREDHLLAGTFQAQLEPGGTVTLVITTDTAASLDGVAAYEAQRQRERALLKNWAQAFPRESNQAPPWIAQLVLAAQQFVVERSGAGRPDGCSVIAGYPWFGEWGRDTMIALPGLALSTGQFDVARSILRTFAKSLDRGQLPNRIPESGAPPEYNTVDASLWFIEAVRQYVEATGDAESLREFFPAVEAIVRSYSAGSRYRIHVDPTDGLLYAGEPGVQLTWMDAKVGDWVVTPRIGKPVEVNALWYNALVAVAGFARRLKIASTDYAARAVLVRASYQRFWDEAAGKCFDVLDGPNGHDASLRPNQILAVSLPASPLEPRQQRAVVELCARRLLTSFGLRSLAPEDPRYRAHYEGGPRERDIAYHQGTAWGWLIGPFVLAHLKVFGDPQAARSFLEPFAHQMRGFGLGTLGEIFDGDAPFTPRGCIAQAWTVGEVLRAWMATTAQLLKNRTRIVPPVPRQRRTSQRAA